MAALSRSSASMVRFGVSAVQASETANGPGSAAFAASPTSARPASASESNGPWREERTVIVRGSSSPATVISSFRTCSGT